MGKKQEGIVCRGKGSDITGRKQALGAEGREGRREDQTEVGRHTICPAKQWVPHTVVFRAPLKDSEGGDISWLAFSISLCGVTGEGRMRTSGGARCPFWGGEV